MKLEKYIMGLQKVLDEHGDLECYTAGDDEGNSYHHVCFEPSVGFYDNDFEFVDEDQFDEYEDDDFNINAVCVN